MRLRCSAACVPGLEPLVVDELARLGVRAEAPVAGQVPFSATPRQLFATCLRSAVASRVLVRVARFQARTFAELERRWSTLAGGTRVHLLTTAAAGAGMAPGPHRGHRGGHRTSTRPDGHELEGVAPDPGAGTLPTGPAAPALPSTLWAR